MGLSQGGSVRYANGMSQTITAVIIQFLTIGLPMIGIQVGSDQLTVALQTIIVIVSGLWIWVRRVQMGGVNTLGKRI